MEQLQQVNLKDINFSIDKVKENRKSLSLKTQKLIQTTSAISNSLSQLEHGNTSGQAFQFSTSNALLGESLNPRLSTVAAIKEQVAAMTLQEASNKIDVVQEQDVSFKSQIDVPSRESVKLVTEIIQAEAPHLRSDSALNLKETKKLQFIEEKAEDNAILENPKPESQNHAIVSITKRTSVVHDSASHPNDGKRGSREYIQPSQAVPVRKISLKKIDPISIKEKAPELKLEKQENVEARTVIIGSKTTSDKYDIIEAKTHHETQNTIDVTVSSNQVDNSHLLKRISDLEKLLTESKSEHNQTQNLYSTLLSKFESGKHHNQDLQMRNSRNELEMKSLLEQNEILRAENRRISEMESNLRIRVLELSQPKEDVKPSSLDSSDIALQEKLVNQVDDQLGWINVHFEAAKENPFTLKNLQSFDAMLHQLKKSIKNVSDCSPKTVLNILRSLTQIQIQSLQTTWNSCAQANMLEKQLDVSQKESAHIGKEANEKIKQMVEEHDQRITSIISSKKQIQQQLNSLMEKYKLIKEENEELRKANDELFADNQALLSVVQKPEEPKQVLLVTDPKSDASEKHIESLGKINHELRLRITQMNQTVDSWKLENQSLQEELAKLLKDKAHQESQIVILSQNISDLDNELQDEKLTSLQAGEVIKSLQSQLEEAKKTKHNSEFDHFLANQMALINANSNKSEGGKEESFYEAQVLSFIKDTHQKVKQIQELEGKINDSKFTISKLEEENTKLKTKNIQIKDKFQVREVAWLERLKKSKDELESITFECQSMKEHLRAYQDQYQSIIETLDEDEKRELSQESHPYTFARVFNHLVQKKNLSALKCQELERNLLSTKHAYDDTSKDLLLQIRQFETLGSETKSTRDQLVEISGVKAALESKIQLLEEKLRDASSEKEKAQLKLKTVVGKMIEYIQLNED